MTLESCQSLPWSGPSFRGPYLDGPLMGLRVLPRAEHTARMQHRLHHLPGHPIPSWVLSSARDHMPALPLLSGGPAAVLRQNSSSSGPPSLPTWQKGCPTGGSGPCPARPGAGQQHHHSRLPLQVPGPSLKTDARVVRQPSAGAGGWAGTGVPGSSTSRCVTQTRTGPSALRVWAPRSSLGSRERAVSACTQGLPHRRASAGSLLCWPGVRPLPEEPTESTRLTPTQRGDLEDSPPTPAHARDRPPCASWHTVGPQPTAAAIPSCLANTDMTKGEERIRARPAPPSWACGAPRGSTPGPIPRGEKAGRRHVDHTTKKD